MDPLKEISFMKGKMCLSALLEIQRTAYILFFLKSNWVLFFRTEHWPDFILSINKAKSFQQETQTKKKIKKRKYRQSAHHTKKNLSSIFNFKCNIEIDTDIQITCTYKEEDYCLFVIWYFLLVFSLDEDVFLWYTLTHYRVPRLSESVPFILNKDTRKESCPRRGPLASYRNPYS